MAMMKVKEIRDMSPEELDAAMVQARQEIFVTRNSFKTTKKADKPHVLRHKKKDIARILTVLREKELAKE